MERFERKRAALMAEHAQSPRIEVEVEPVGNVGEIDEAVFGELDGAFWKEIMGDCDLQVY